MQKEYFSNYLSLQQVTIQDPFWNNYMKLAKDKIIPYQWEALNDRIPDAQPSHCIKNFKIAARIEKGEFGGFVFQDSDLAKWIEAAAYLLLWQKDPNLEETVDGVIDLIVSAQQEDGYLNTYYIIHGLDKRWTDLMNNHELYCAGHMLEAAVAYYQATGKSKFIDAMIRFVAHIDSIFGPEPEKKKGYPGHEVLEMALMKLYQITKDEKHLKLARYFIEQRGQQPLYFKLEEEENGAVFPWKDSYFQYQYYQAGLPVLQHDKAEGHAVRAVYLYSGMADIARETMDDALYQTCRKLWNNIATKRMYITGAIGSCAYGESFTFDYDLPNDTVYGETCASIGLLFFSHRMLRIHPKRQYADVMEKVLYNGIISGISLDGTRFFYVNPLEVVPEACEKDQLRRHVKPQRQRWFGCACCPPNLSRTITSLAGYIYTQNDTALYIHLYIGNDSTVYLHGIKTKINITTRYPWNEEIEIRLSPEEKVTASIALRIPGWCREYSIWKDGKKLVVSNDMVKDGYLILSDDWTDGSLIQLHMNMPVEVICSNPMVRENTGKVSVMRGPIVYCLEEEDNGPDLNLLTLPDTPQFSYRYEENILGGIVQIESDGYLLNTDDFCKDTLYDFYQKNSYKKKTLTWIPYYTWANRSLGEMLVWVRSR